MGVHSRRCRGVSHHTMRHTGRKVAAWRPQCPPVGTSSCPGFELSISSGAAPDRAMRLSSGVAPALAMLGRRPRDSGLRADGSSPRFGGHRSRARCPFLGDVRPVDFARARAFVLSTKPARRNARWKLDRAVRRALGARRLYSQHNSVTVASGPSRTTARSTVTSIGHCQPPPLGCGARDCVSRQRATHRSSVRWSTSNSAASRAYDPSPRSYAVTARSRSARSYGLGMAPLKYSSFGHSSGIRG